MPALLSCSDPASSSSSSFPIGGVGFGAEGEGTAILLLFFFSPHKKKERKKGRHGQRAQSLRERLGAFFTVQWPGRGELPNTQQALPKPRWESRPRVVRKRGPHLGARTCDGCLLVYKTLVWEWRRHLVVPSPQCAFNWSMHLIILRFTCYHAFSCGLHRPTSRVIHR